MGRAVSKSFSPSVIIPGGAVMENKYVSFEVYRPAKSPTEKGEYMERHQTWSRHGGPLMLLAVPCTG